jgi:hypothetical protein
VSKVGTDFADDAEGRVDHDVRAFCLPGH